MKPSRSVVSCCRRRIGFGLAVIMERRLLARPTARPAIPRAAPDQRHPCPVLRFRHWTPPPTTRGLQAALGRSRQAAAGRDSPVSLTGWDSVIAAPYGCAAHVPVLGHPDLPPLRRGADLQPWRCPRVGHSPTWKPSSAPASPPTAYAASLPASLRRRRTRCRPRGSHQPRPTVLVT